MLNLIDPSFHSFYTNLNTGDDVPNIDKDIVEDEYLNENIESP